MPVEHGCRVVFLGAGKQVKFMYEEDRCPLPDVKNGEVLVRVLLAGICEHVLELNQRETEQVVPAQNISPCVPGHEAVAEVIASGRPPGELAEGQRVVFGVTDTCQSCDECQNGLSKYCQMKIKYGEQLISGDGAYLGSMSRFMLLGAGTKVVPLPDNVPDREAVTIATQLPLAIEAASSAPGDKNSKILIQGTTLTGIYACALLKHRGYEHIFCFDRDRNRVVRTASFGGTVIHPDLPSYGDSPRESQVAMVIDTTCTSESIKSSLYFLRRGGTYVLVATGSNIQKAAIPQKVLLEKGLVIKGISEPNPDFLEEGVKFLEATQSQFPFAGLFSVEFPLKDFHVALKEATNQEHFRVFVKP